MAFDLAGDFLTVAFFAVAFFAVAFFAVAFFAVLFLAPGALLDADVLPLLTRSVCPAITRVPFMPFSD